MSYAESIIKLRNRVQDAVKKGLVEDSGKEFFEATLIQVMNEAEKNRNNCLAQAENLRKQASVFDGQAAAFGSVSSIVFSVINGYVTVVERDEAERAAQEAEKASDAQEESLEVSVVTDPVVAEENTKKSKKKKA
jgi:hypothetical protein